MSEEKKTTEENEVVETPQATDDKPVEETKTEETKTEEVKEEAKEEAKEEVKEEVAPETSPEELKPGMVIRVHETIKDTNAKGEERQRTQIFEGTLLGFGGSGITRTITVRKVSNGVGVEKIYPLSSPNVSQIEIVKRHKVRRAKMWFLRHGFKRKMKEDK